MNIAVDPGLLDEIRKAGDAYGGRLGLFMGAAALLMLEQDPAVQSKYIARLLQAELQNQCDDIVKEIKNEQAVRVNARLKKEHKNP